MTHKKKITKVKTLHPLTIAVICNLYLPCGFSSCQYSTRVSALFITCTLFLVFADVTSSKTSSRVIPRNNSSNNLLRAVFWLESDKNTARNKLYSKNYSRYVGLRISSGTGAKIVSSRTFFSSSIIFFIVNFFSVKKKKSLQLSP